MKNKQIIETSPNTMECIRKWYSENLKKSLDNEKISEEFKTAILEEGLLDESVDELIEKNPSILLDFFDQKLIFCSVTPVTEDSRVIFKTNFLDSSETRKFDTRFNATRYIILEAFLVLEKLYNIDVAL